VTDLPQQTDLEHPTTIEHQGLNRQILAEICAEGNARIAQLHESRAARVFILSGPSGVGKDSVLEKLREVYPDAQYVVTATSRPMRPGEIDGVHYLFLDRDDFEQQIARGDFIEHALVYDNLYGVPRRPIEEGLAAGRHVIIKVDVKGAATLRDVISNTVSLFLLPESMEALLERLRSRKTEDPDVLLKRFRTANEELARLDEFDYIVFNEAGKLDEALDHIVGVIETEQKRVHLADITIS
jgi:guanylate kinase